MLEKISNLGIALNKNEQKTINGGTNCRTCYANNGGAYNSSDPNCWECPIPYIL
ncbi:hypothetical protein P8625_15795 [Tenacibaculum tangerinum]|uniref:Bacteriocin n=1 Tax=Tenacibaculum tangerinum TaxID=3038772 RepID=A0ABY8L229_9FLAO|nr:hypothetical protein [Tenacibaculum tangerinum]WGH75503.1 hypothetical protein P8625_15795 [Tenacibaculum tangerinum]